MSRDSEVRDVTARLETLLDKLKVNVAALNAILGGAGDADNPPEVAPSDAPPEEAGR